MPDGFPFDGFPRALVAFYEDLSYNNNRAWFNEHKDIYKQHVIAPAQDFVRAMGARLRALAPDVVADPRANGAGSIFRIYRDTRFSKDKTPYKTFLGIFFWEGSRKKTENSGFYFHLEPPRLMLAAGIHVFPRTLLGVYRDAVVDPEHGSALVKAVKQVSARGPYEIGGRHYKRVPQGYDAAHENADFLLHNGLHATIEGDIPEELYTEGCLDYCFERFRDMAPIHDWLRIILERD
jgi:uncharacterized protein (TIGR02453 family)